MSQEDQASSLARWLDEPAGAPPPSDLDADVIEAIYAARPDRAPALKLTAEDILASVTSGPLAADGAAREPEARSAPGEVVPFPARPPRHVEEPEAPVRSERRSPARWIAWAGGSSSIGLAAVAAAVLLFVALPTARQEVATSGSRDEMAPAAATAPVEQQAEGERTDRAAAAAPAELKAEPAAAPPPPPAALPSRRAEGAEKVAAQQPIEMRDGALFKSETTIPELDDAVADAVAVAEDAPATEETKDLEAKRQVLASEDEAVDPGSVRVRAVPRDRSSNGWRKGVDRATLDLFDAGLAEAEALRTRGDPGGASARLSPLIGAPSRAGQHVAALAVQDALAAGDTTGALSLARRGLGLSSANTAERSWLLVVYGDALMASGDTAGAVDAWQQAEQANATR
ncbi:MAG: hypothetical protein H6735_04495 [Alphaproteobacteria bacterium]|nr:hypothetical protein [Alphaproteobacteria bacterium]